MRGQRPWFAFPERLATAHRPRYFATPGTGWELLLRFANAGAQIVRVPRFTGAFRVHDRQKTSRELQGRGANEMRRLRRQQLGRDVTAEEVERRVGGYLTRSILYDGLYRLGVLEF